MREHDPQIKTTKRQFVQDCANINSCVKYKTSFFKSLPQSNLLSTYLNSSITYHFNHDKNQLNFSNKITLDLH